MKAQLNIEFLAGEDIQDACLEAVRLANLLRVIASFDFNGVKVMAKPGAFAALRQKLSEFRKAIGSLRESFATLLEMHPDDLEPQ